MLKLFGGRENVDKERFIYDHIEKDTIVIVPDQYTLIAEEQALRFTGRACLFDIEILGMNRLGMRILREEGLENIEVLDKYGRYMYLAKIIKENRSDFEIFKKAAGKPAFVSMVNDFISDCKKQNIDCGCIGGLIDSDEINELLKLKLTELRRIFQEYDDKIEGKYLDSEDYILKYISLIKNAKFIKDKTFWVYGFDSITPMFLNALTELAKYSRGVNLIINESSFGLGSIVRRMVEDAAENNGIDHEYEIIGEEYGIVKSEEIQILERKLFSHNSVSEKNAAGENTDRDERCDVTLIEAANPYNEAENAAIYITKLIRDEHYKLSEIAIIANEEKQMQSIVKRGFSEYGLNIFADSRRNITDTQVVIFIISQLKCISGKLRSSDLMTMLKSGLTCFSKDEIELLDSYVKNYGIKGNMWRKPFKYHQDKESDILKELNEIRIKAYTKLEKLEKIVKNAKTVNDFINEYLEYLEDEWAFTASVEYKMRNLSKTGYNASAQVMSGSYDAVIHIMEQAATIIGEEKFDINEFIELYEAGIVNVDIATIPPVKDEVSMGTLIRTRPGSVRAIIILGANEGILPLAPNTEGLFSVDEKSFFKNREFKLGRLDDLKQLEENSALYRVLSKPKDKLYISYSLSDAGGNARKAASFIMDIKSLLGIEIEKDLISQGFSSRLIQSKYEALRHSINYLNSRKEPDKDDGEAVAKWKERDGIASSVLSWFEENDSNVAEAVKQAAIYENKMRNINPELAGELFKNRKGELSFSATGMEKFRHCPFRHFIEKGLRPEEDREFKTDVRDVGEMYHSCIMRASESIMNRRDEFAKLYDKAVNDSDAETFESKIESMVKTALHEESGRHRGGIFNSDENEKFRLSRLEQICIEAVKAIAEQLIDDNLSKAFFEKSFKNDSNAVFSPIKIQIGDETVYVEGKIDRVDYIGNSGIRVIDYKTGNDTVNKDYMRNGYKMQLMVYLEGVSDEMHKPAGIFYFNIKDEVPNITNKQTKAAEKLIEENENRFALRGLYIMDSNDPELRPKGVGKQGSIGITAEEFDDIREDVRAVMKDIAAGIVNGDISINPVAAGKGSSMKKECTYCQYKSICRFDLSYEGNDFRYI